MTGLDAFAAQLADAIDDVLEEVAGAIELGIDDGRRGRMTFSLRCEHDYRIGHEIGSAERRLDDGPTIEEVFPDL